MAQQIVKCQVDNKNDKHVPVECMAAVWVKFILSLPN